MSSGSPPTTASSTAAVLNPRTIALSIRLLRPNSTAITSLKPSHGFTQYQCTVGTFFGGNTGQDIPEWVKFMEPSSPGVGVHLMAQQVGAVLFIEVVHAGAPRLLAVCFGLGHHKLETDRIERQFGLRVVLNSVSRKALRVLDSATLDSTVINRRAQASRAVDLNIFGLDTERDLLRLASGKPSNLNLAKALAGKDSLNIRKKISVFELPVLCLELLAVYDSTAYKTHFSFIDNIRPEKDTATIAALENKAFNEIASMVSGGSSEMHLAVTDPDEPVGWDAVGYYGACLPRKGKEFYSDIDMSDYVDELRKGNFSSLHDMAGIREHEIRSQDTGKGTLRLYDCLVWETTHATSQYVLFDGDWYEIDSKYAAGINSAYHSLVSASPLVVSTKAKNEREFIAELTLNSNLLCLDQTRISPLGAGRAQIEACDFFSTSKQLIHLKDGNSAAPLSHLWNQAIVSCESLMRDQNARKQFRSVIRRREKDHAKTGFSALAPDVAKMAPDAFPVVLGVLRKSNASGKLDISFFARVALAAAVRKIEMMNFKVEVHLIKKV